MALRLWSMPSKESWREIVPYFPKTHSPRIESWRRNAGSRILPSVRLLSQYFHAFEIFAASTRQACSKYCPSILKQQKKKRAKKKSAKKKSAKKKSALLSS